MGVCCNMYRRRPDGQLCNRISEIFAENLSCLRVASGQWGTVVRTVACPLQVISIKAIRAFGPRGWPSRRLIFNTQFPYQMSARPDHERQASGRLKLNTQFPYLLNVHPDQADWSTDGCIWIAILALWMSASGRESTSSGRLHQSSLIWSLERKSEADRSLEVVRTGCWDVRTNASWNRSFSM
jgi:hypothetical protein